MIAAYPSKAGSGLSVTRLIEADAYDASFLGAFISSGVVVGLATFAICIGLHLQFGYCICLLSSISRRKQLLPLPASDGSGGRSNGITFIYGLRLLQRVSCGGGANR